DRAIEADQPLAGRRDDGAAAAAAAGRGRDRRRPQRMVDPSTSSQARRYDMPSARAAAEIEPVARMASSSAIFPGPMRSPFSRSMRMDRRVPVMAFGSRERNAL